MAAISDDQRDQVLKLHAEGLSRNEIARRTGISAGSVTNICRENDRGFDRSATKDAQAARAVDLTGRRLTLADRLDVAANAMLDMIDHPFTVFNFGGKDNTFASAELESAPVEARRTIITSAAIVFDKISKIIDSTPADGADDAESLLDRIEADLEVEFTDADDAEFGVSP